MFKEIDDIKKVLIEYGYRININKILEHFAKVSFFGAANMIKKTDMGDNMSISISRMILNI